MGMTADASGPILVAPIVIAPVQLTETIAVMIVVLFIGFWPILYALIRKRLRRVLADFVLTILLMTPAALE
jgi:hypothetical protein